MSVLKLVFSKMVILVVFTLFFLIAVYFIMPIDQNNYYKAQQEKEALLKKIPSPRLIMIGGSSTAFGIDSNLIGSAIGMPTINVGLHVSLGLSNILNSVRPNIHEGDVLLLMPEYEAYSYPPAIWGDTLTLADMYNVYPSYLLYIDMDYYSTLPEILLFGLQRRLDQAVFSRYYLLDQTRGVYQRSNFNLVGDMVGHLNKPGWAAGEISKSAYSTTIDVKAIQIINDFVEFAHSNGAIVVLDYPPARESNCIATTYEALNTFDEQLRIYLDISILSSPKARCYPDANFFDSVYHLTAEGRKTHSNDIIDSLLPVLR
jgi:hypothetical protein